MPKILPPPLLCREEHREAGCRCMYSYGKRTEFIETNAWFILTKETASELALFLKGMRVADLGAGNGFLGAHMRALGVEHYHAYDNHRHGYYKKNHLHYGIRRKCAYRVKLERYDAIVMTWPLYNDPFAYRMASRMKRGQVLIYQGESKGGCTGDDSFFDLLEHEFELLSEITYQLEDNHIRWCGINDQWMVYKKR